MEDDEERLAAFYARAVEWRQRCEQRYEQARKEKQETEVDGCTFAPAINAASKRMCKVCVCVRLMCRVWRVGIAQQVAQHGPGSVIQLQVVAACLHLQPLRFRCEGTALCGRALQRCSWT